MNSHIQIAFVFTSLVAFLLVFSAMPVRTLRRLIADERGGVRLADGPSLDSKAPPDQQRAALATFLGLGPDAGDDDVRALVDAILSAAMAADPDADGNADPSAPPPAQTGATYRVMHNGDHGAEILSVRLNARELGVCARNGLSKEQYARAKVKMHGTSPARSAYGIRRIGGV